MWIAENKNHYLKEVFRDLTETTSSLLAPLTYFTKYFYLCEHIWQIG